MQYALEVCKKRYQEEDQMLFEAVLNLKKGNKKSFEQVYKLSERYIYSIIHRIVRDNEKTADIMQDTYVQVYNKIHTLINAESFLIWAGRIAANNALRFIQKDSLEVLTTEESEDFIFEAAADDEEFLPEDILLSKEKRKKIHDIIDNLPTLQRITVLYYYFGEMSINEIAEVMECSPGTVKSRLNYARNQIKQAVIDTERKEGIKLYSFSALPLFALILREEMSTVVVPEAVSSSVIKGVVNVLGINLANTTGMGVAELGKKGFKETIRSFFRTTTGKVTSGVVATTMAGTIAVTQIPRTLYVTPNRIEGYFTYELSYKTDIRLYHEDAENLYLIDDEYLILKNEDGEKGLYTIKGKEILPTEFDNISYDENTGGLFLVRKNNKYAYYDKNGKMVCDKMYDDVSLVIDGIFWGYDAESDKYKVYSVDGYAISDATFDCVEDMANGLIAVSNEFQWGVLRKDGKLIVPIDNDMVYLGDGEYIAIYKTIDVAVRRLTVLDSYGNKIYEGVYEGGLTMFGSGFYNGVAQLIGWYEFPISTDGTILFNTLGTDYSTDSLGYHLNVYPNGYFSYYNYKKGNGEISLFNKEGKEIAVAAYGGCIYIDEKFIIKDNYNGKYSLIDDKGNTIIPQYDGIDPRYNGKYYICYDENGYDLYRKDGTLLYNDAVDIYSIGCEMFLCDRQFEKDVVNGQDGTSFKLSPEEDIKSNYCDGYAIKYTDYYDVEEEPCFKYEIIDKNGKVVYEIKLPEDYYDFENVIVLKEGLYSYVHKGKCYIKTW